MASDSGFAQYTDTGSSEYPGSSEYSGSSEYPGTGNSVLPTPVARPAARRRRQLILLVEDDPRDLHLYGTTLWYNGFDVLEASDGRSAVALTLEHEPDLVLLDLLLPDLTGFDVCRSIREAGSDVPVVALTGRARLEFGPLAEKAGCTGYLEKPIGPLQVLHYVEDIVGRPPLPGEDDITDPEEHDPEDHDPEERH